MNEAEVLKQISKFLITAMRNGDAALELVQVDGGMEVNFVGADGVGVGHTWPEDSGIALFKFIQNQKRKTGSLTLLLQRKTRAFPVEEYTYLKKPALRIHLTPVSN
jgi:hypothetical protein